MFPGGGARHGGSQNSTWMCPGVQSGGRVTWQRAHCEQRAHSRGVSLVETRSELSAVVKFRWQALRLAARSTTQPQCAGRSGPLAVPKSSQTPASAAGARPHGPPPHGPPPPPHGPPPPHLLKGGVGPLSLMALRPATRTRPSSAPSASEAPDYAAAVCQGTQLKPSSAPSASEGPSAAAQQGAQASAAASVQGQRLKPKAKSGLIDQLLRASADQLIEGDKEDDAAEAPESASSASKRSWTDATSSASKRSCTSTARRLPPPWRRKQADDGAVAATVEKKAASRAEFEV